MGFEEGIAGLPMEAEGIAGSNRIGRDRKLQVGCSFSGLGEKVLDRTTCGHQCVEEIEVHLVASLHVAGEAWWWWR